MAYGESLGISTLAKNLINLSECVYKRIDNGDSYRNILKDQALWLMEGSVELYKRLAEDVMDDLDQEIG